MAQYYTDFQDQTKGNFPSGWTARSASDQSDWDIQEMPDDATDLALHLMSGASGRMSISWDEIDSDPDRDDVEIYATAWVVDDDAFGMARRQGTTGTDEDLYRGGLRPGRSEGSAIEKYENDSFTSITSSGASLSTGQRYHFRFRVTGSDLKLRWWEPGDSEPSTWGLEVTDSTITGVGHVGIHTFASSGEEFYVAEVGIGTGGDPAPTEDTGGAVSLTAEQGSYSLSGQTANLLASRLLTSDQGTYSLSGQDASLLIGRLLEATQGTYAATGQDADLIVSRLLTAAQGSYTLTGQDATLTYSQATGFTMTADSGTYSLTGQDAALLAFRTLAAQQGTYALNGQDAALLRGVLLSASQGSYTRAGQSAILLAGRLLEAEQGDYSVSGQPATLVYSGAELLASLEAVLSDTITLSPSLTDTITLEPTLED